MVCVEFRYIVFCISKQFDIYFWYSVAKIFEKWFHRATNLCLTSGSCSNFFLLVNIDRFAIKIRQKKKYSFQSSKIEIFLWIWEFAATKIGNVPSTLTLDHQKIECQWEKSSISACLLYGFFCLSCGFRKESFFGTVSLYRLLRFLVSYWKRQRPHRAIQTKKKSTERIKSVKWKSFVFRLLLMVSREKLYIEYVPNVEMYDFPMLFDGWYALCDERLFYESRLFSNWMPKWNWIRFHS